MAGTDVPISPPQVIPVLRRVIEITDYDNGNPITHK